MGMMPPAIDSRGFRTDGMQRVPRQGGGEPQWPPLTPRKPSFLPWVAVAKPCRSHIDSNIPHLGSENSFLSSWEIDVPAAQQGIVARASTFQTGQAASVDLRGFRS